LTDFTQPSVAHNPEPDEYLVVWQSDHDQPDDLTRIRGIRLRADTGASIGATFVVSDTPGLERKAIDPSVTANPLPGKTWRWLVTWSDSRDGSTAANYRIYGRQLSGTVAFQGPAFAIGTTFLPTHVQGSSAAAFNPTIGQYLVAYEHANGVDDAILVTRVNGDTGVAGGTLDATDVYDTSLDDASHPAVAYNAWARAHVVSWVTEESASSWSVSWLSLDNTAAIPLGRLTSQAPWPFVDPAVAPEYGGNWATTYSQREASPATDFDLGFRWLSGASCCGLAGLLTSGHAGTTPVDDDRLSAVHSNPYYGFSLAVWQFAESATNIDLHAARVWGGAYPIVTATSNFDGVGGADQAVVRLGPSGAMTWFVSGNTGAWAVDWGDAGDVPVAGDYDGDGRADVAVWRPGNGAWYVVRSSSGTAFGRVFGSGAHADQPVPGDYDGDGRTDVAVYRPGNPAVFYIVRSSDNVAYAVLWGTWGDVPLTGDYDGDGRTDIAVWRPASPPDAVGAFFIVPSGGGPAYGRAWGQAGDHPVAGDFDGDGKDDLAVFRPATIDACGWYIVRSSTGAATHTAWGALGDIPVPADYDHDGKTDIAVWRPGATGVFYLLRSAGAPVGLAWGSGFDLPIAR
jgi:hypothetical protein